MERRRNAFSEKADRRMIFLKPGTPEPCKLTEVDRDSCDWAAVSMDEEKPELRAAVTTSYVYSADFLDVTPSDRVVEAYAAAFVGSALVDLTTWPTLSPHFPPCFCLSVPDSGRASVAALSSALMDEGTCLRIFENRRSWKEWKTQTRRVYFVSWRD